jgi:hypothetical protein
MIWRILSNLFNVKCYAVLALHFFLFLSGAPGISTQEPGDKVMSIFVDEYKYLGRNTMLNIVDGLWDGPEATKSPVKWKMEPFNDDWLNSIFVSQDQVALESVCFDFLRSESKIGLPDWKNRPEMAQGVDDYLHHAASSENWPEGIIYDTDNSGVPIPSLGVHEHWDNAVNKNYSRNLVKNEGIELVKVLAAKYKLPL